MLPSEVSYYSSINSNSQLWLGCYTMGVISILFIVPSCFLLTPIELFVSLGGESPGIDFLFNPSGSPEF